MDQLNFLKRPAGGGEKNIESIGKKGGKARELKLNSASLLHLLFPSLPPPPGGRKLVPTLQCFGIWISGSETFHLAWWRASYGRGIKSSPASAKRITSGDNSLNRNPSRETFIYQALHLPSPPPPSPNSLSNSRNASVKRCPLFVLFFRLRATLP